MSHDPASAPAAPESLEPGRFGTFLADKGIASKRLSDSCGVETIEVSADDLKRALAELRTNEETRLGLLLTISGVDMADSIDSVYHLRSYYSNDELVVKVVTPKASIPEGRLPLVPSLANEWPAADWHERETYDLVGIRYIGHPYLRRILNPWDWEGHPLRRDYRQPVDALNDKNPHSFR